MRSSALTCSLISLCLLLLSGCSSARDPNAKTWTASTPHAALQPGVTMRGSYDPMMCPCVPDYFVVRRDGSFVKTFDQLQAVLRPIDSEHRALAYRKLLGWIVLERDETLKALQWTAPLEFDEGEQPFFGVYVAADAERWGVGHKPVIEVTEQQITITQPSFRIIETIGENGQAMILGDGVVELVREGIHRDGRYEREVLRVLEEGESARVHQPAALL